MKKASVVVPVCNGEDIIGRCLDSMMIQTFKDFEVIVVDDGSTDSTKQIVHRYMEEMDNVKYFYLEQRHGTAGARNYGVAQSESDFIIFTDDDAYAEPDWIERILLSFENEKVGAVTGETKNDGLSIFPWMFTPLSPKCVMCNMAFRKSVIDAIGGLDENFGVLGSDVDLSMRVRDLGYEIADAPDAIVYHPAKEFSLKKLISRADRYKHNNLLYKKYPEDLQNYGFLLRPYVGGFSICGIMSLILLAATMYTLTVNSAYTIAFLGALLVVSWIAFMVYGYKICIVCNDKSQIITFGMKNRTFFTLLYFMPLVLFNRIIGTIKYKKFLF